MATLLMNPVEVLVIAMDHPCEKPGDRDRVSVHCDSLHAVCEKVEEADGEQVDSRLLAMMEETQGANDHRTAGYVKRADIEYLIRRFAVVTAEEIFETEC